MSQSADVCSICLFADNNEGDPIIHCDLCSVPVHQSCYGICNIPQANWYCKSCSYLITVRNQLRLCEITQNRPTHSASSNHSSPLSTLLEPQAPRYVPLPTCLLCQSQSHVVIDLNAISCSATPSASSCGVKPELHWTDTSDSEPRPGTGTGSSLMQLKYSYTSPYTPEENDLIHHYCWWDPSALSCDNLSRAPILFPFLSFLTQVTIRTLLAATPASIAHQSSHSAGDDGMSAASSMAGDEPPAGSHNSNDDNDKDHHIDTILFNATHHVGRSTLYAALSSDLMNILQLISLHNPQLFSRLPLPWLTSAHGDPTSPPVSGVSGPSGHRPSDHGSGDDGSMVDDDMSGIHAPSLSSALSHTNFNHSLTQSQLSHCYTVLEDLFRLNRAFVEDGDCPVQYQDTDPITLQPRLHPSVCLPPIVYDLLKTHLPRPPAYIRDKSMESVSADPSPRDEEAPDYASIVDASSLWSIPFSKPPLPSHDTPEDLFQRFIPSLKESHAKMALGEASSIQSIPHSLEIYDEVASPLSYLFANGLLNHLVSIFLPSSSLSLTTTQNAALPFLSAGKCKTTASQSQRLEGIDGGAQSPCEELSHGGASSTNISGEDSCHQLPPAEAIGIAERPHQIDPASLSPRVSSTSSLPLSLSGGVPPDLSPAQSSLSSDTTSISSHPHTHEVSPASLPHDQELVMPSSSSTLASTSSLMNLIQQMTSQPQLLPAATGTKQGVSVAPAIPPLSAGPPSPTMTLEHVRELRDQQLLTTPPRGWGATLGSLTRVMFSEADFGEIIGLCRRRLTRLDSVHPVFGAISRFSHQFFVSIILEYLQYAPLWIHPLCHHRIRSTHVNNPLTMNLVTGVTRLLETHRRSFRCIVCTKRGGAVQCFQKDCITAFHSHCAHLAGVQLLTSSQLAAVPTRHNYNPHLRSHVLAALPPDSAAQGTDMPIQYCIDHRLELPGAPSPYIHISQRGFWHYKTFRRYSRQICQPSPVARGVRRQPSVTANEMTSISTLQESSTVAIHTHPPVDLDGDVLEQHMSRQSGSTLLGVPDDGCTIQQFEQPQLQQHQQQHYAHPFYDAEETKNSNFAQSVAQTTSRIVVDYASSTTPTHLISAVGHPVIYFLLSLHPEIKHYYEQQRWQQFHIVNLMLCEVNTHAPITYQEWYDYHTPRLSYYDPQATIPANATLSNARCLAFPLNYTPILSSLNAQDPHARYFNPALLLSVLNIPSNQPHETSLAQQLHLSFQRFLANQCPPVLLFTPSQRTDYLSLIFCNPPQYAASYFTQLIGSGHTHFDRISALDAADDSDDLSQIDTILAEYDDPSFIPDEYIPPPKDFGDPFVPHLLYGHFYDYSPMQYLPIPCEYGYVKLRLPGADVSAQPIVLRYRSQIHIDDLALFHDEYENPELLFMGRETNYMNPVLDRLQPAVIRQGRLLSRTNTSIFVCANYIQSLLRYFNLKYIRPICTSPNTLDMVHRTYMEISPLYAELVKDRDVNGQITLSTFLQRYPYRMSSTRYAVAKQYATYRHRPYASPDQSPYECVKKSGYVRFTLDHRPFPTSYDIDAYNANIMVYCEHLYHRRMVSTAINLLERQRYYLNTVTADEEAQRLLVELQGQSEQHLSLVTDDQFVAMAIDKVVNPQHHALHPLPADSYGQLPPAATHQTHASAVVLTDTMQPSSRGSGDSVRGRGGRGGFTKRSAQGKFVSLANGIAKSKYGALNGGNRTTPQIASTTPQGPQARKKTKKKMVNQGSFGFHMTAEAKQQLVAQSFVESSYLHHLYVHLGSIPTTEIEVLVSEFFDVNKYTLAPSNKGDLQGKPHDGQIALTMNSPADSSLDPSQAQPRSVQIPPLPVNTNTITTNSDGAGIPFHQEQSMSDSITPGIVSETSHNPAPLELGHSEPSLPGSPEGNKSSALDDEDDIVEVIPIQPTSKLVRRKVLIRIVGGRPVPPACPLTFIVDLMKGPIVLTNGRYIQLKKTYSDDEELALVQDSFRYLPSEESLSQVSTQVGSAANMLEIHGDSTNGGALALNNLCGWQYRLSGQGQTQAFNAPGGYNINRIATRQRKLKPTVSEQPRLFIGMRLFGRSLDKFVWAGRVYKRRYLCQFKHIVTQTRHEKHVQPASDAGGGDEHALSSSPSQDIQLLSGYELYDAYMKLVRTTTQQLVTDNILPSNLVSLDLQNYVTPPTEISPQLFFIAQPGRDGFSLRIRATLRRIDGRPARQGIETARQVFTLREAAYAQMDHAALDLRESSESLDSIYSKYNYTLPSREQADFRGRNGYAPLWADDPDYIRHMAEYDATNDRLNAEYYAQLHQTSLPPSSPTVTVFDPVPIGMVALNTSTGTDDSDILDALGLSDFEYEQYEDKKARRVTMNGTIRHYDNFTQPVSQYGNPLNANNSLHGSIGTGTGKGHDDHRSSTYQRRITSILALNYNYSYTNPNTQQREAVFDDGLDQYFLPLTLDDVLDPEESINLVSSLQHGEDVILQEQELALQGASGQYGGKTPSSARTLSSMASSREGDMADTPSKDDSDTEVGVGIGEIETWGHDITTASRFWARLESDWLHHKYDAVEALLLHFRFYGGLIHDNQLAFVSGLTPSPPPYSHHRYPHKTSNFLYNAHHVLNYMYQQFTQFTQSLLSPTPSLASTPSSGSSSTPSHDLSTAASITAFIQAAAKAGVLTKYDHHSLLNYTHLLSHVANITTAAFNTYNVERIAPDERNEDMGQHRPHGSHTYCVEIPYNEVLGHGYGNVLSYPLTSFEMDQLVSAVSIKNLLDQAPPYSPRPIKTKGKRKTTVTFFPSLSQLQIIFKALRQFYSSSTQSKEIPPPKLHSTILPSDGAHSEDHDNDDHDEDEDGHDNGDDNDDEHGSNKEKDNDHGNGHGNETGNHTAQEDLTTLTTTVPGSSQGSLVENLAGSDTDTSKPAPASKPNEPSSPTPGLKSTRFIPRGRKKRGPRPALSSNLLQNAHHKQQASELDATSTQSVKVYTLLFELDQAAIEQILAIHSDELQNPKTASREVNLDAFIDSVIPSNESTDSPTVNGHTDMSISFADGTLVKLYPLASKEKSSPSHPHISSEINTTDSPYVHLSSNTFLTAGNVTPLLEVTQLDSSNVLQSSSCSLSATLEPLKESPIPYNSSIQPADGLIESFVFYNDNPSDIHEFYSYYFQQQQHLNDIFQRQQLFQSDPMLAALRQEISMFFTALQMPTVSTLMHQARNILDQSLTYHSYPATSSLNPHSNDSTKNTPSTRTLQPSVDLGFPLFLTQYDPDHPMPPWLLPPGFVSQTSMRFTNNFYPPGMDHPSLTHISPATDLLGPIGRKTAGKGASASQLQVPGKPRQQSTTADPSPATGSTVISSQLIDDGILSSYRYITQKNRSIDMLTGRLRVIDYAHRKYVHSTMQPYRRDVLFASGGIPHFRSNLLFNYMANPPPHVLFLAEPEYYSLPSPIPPGRETSTDQQQQGASVTTITTMDNSSSVTGPTLQKSPSPHATSQEIQQIVTDYYDPFLHTNSFDFVNALPATSDQFLGVTSDYSVQVKTIPQQVHIYTTPSNRHDASLGCQPPTALYMDQILSHTSFFEDSMQHDGFYIPPSSTTTEGGPPGELGVESQNLSLPIVGTLFRTSNYRLNRDVPSLYIDEALGRITLHYYDVFTLSQHLALSNFEKDLLPQTQRAQQQWVDANAALFYHQHETVDSVSSADNRIYLEHPDRDDNPDAMDSPSTHKRKRSSLHTDLPSASADSDDIDGSMTESALEPSHQAAAKRPRPNHVKSLLKEPNQGSTSSINNNNNNNNNNNRHPSPSSSMPFNLHVGTTHDYRRMIQRLRWNATFPPTIEQYNTLSIPFSRLVEYYALPMAATTNNSIIANATTTASASAGSLHTMNPRHSNHHYQLSAHGGLSFEDQSLMLHQTINASTDGKVSLGLTSHVAEVLAPKIPIFPLCLPSNYTLLTPTADLHQSGTLQTTPSAQDNEALTLDSIAVHQQLRPRDTLLLGSYSVLSLTRLQENAGVFGHYINPHIQYRSTTLDPSLRLSGNHTIHPSLLAQPTHFILIKLLQRFHSMAVQGHISTEHFPTTLRTAIRRLATKRSSSPISPSTTGLTEQALEQLCRQLLLPCIFNIIQRGSYHMSHNPLVTHFGRHSDRLTPRESAHRAQPQQPLWSSADPELNSTLGKVLEVDSDSTNVQYELPFVSLCRLTMILKSEQRDADILQERAQLSTTYLDSPSDFLTQQQAFERNRRKNVKILYNAYHQHMDVIALGSCPHTIPSGVPGSPADVSCTDEKKAETSSSLSESVLDALPPQLPSYILPIVTILAHHEAMSHRIRVILDKVQRNMSRLKAAHHYRQQQHEQGHALVKLYRQQAHDNRQRALDHRRLQATQLLNTLQADILDPLLGTYVSDTILPRDTMTTDNKVTRIDMIDPHLQMGHDMPSLESIPPSGEMTSINEPTSAALPPQAHEQEQELQTAPTATTQLLLPYQTPPNDTTGSSTTHSSTCINSTSNQDAVALLSRCTNLLEYVQTVCSHLQLFPVFTPPIVLVPLRFNKFLARSRAIILNARMWLSRFRRCSICFQGGVSDAQLMKMIYFIMHGAAHIPPSLRAGQGHVGVAHSTGAAMLPSHKPVSGMKGVVSGKGKVEHCPEDLIPAFKFASHKDIQVVFVGHGESVPAWMVELLNVCNGRTEVNIGGAPAAARHASFMKSVSHILEQDPQPMMSKHSIDANAAPPPHTADESGRSLNASPQHSDAEMNPLTAPIKSPVNQLLQAFRQTFASELSPDASVGTRHLVTTKGGFTHDEVEEMYETDRSYTDRIWKELCQFMVSIDIHHTHRPVSGDAEGGDIPTCFRDAIVPQDGHKSPSLGTILVCSICGCATHTECSGLKPQLPSLLAIVHAIGFLYRIHLTDTLRTSPSSPMADDDPDNYKPFLLDALSGAPLGAPPPSQPGIISTTQHTLNSVDATGSEPNQAESSTGTHDQVTQPLCDLRDVIRQSNTSCLIHDLFGDPQMTISRGFAQTNLFLLHTPALLAAWKDLLNMLQCPSLFHNHFLYLSREQSALETASGHFATCHTTHRLFDQIRQIHAHHSPDHPCDLSGLGVDQTELSSSAGPLHTSIAHNAPDTRPMLSGPKSSWSPIRHDPRHVLEESLTQKLLHCYQFCPWNAQEKQAILCRIKTQLSERIFQYHVCQRCELIQAEAPLNLDTFHRASTNICAMCGKSGGSMVISNENEWIHTPCALHVPELYFSNSPMDVVLGAPQALQERKSLSCYLCRQQYGACVQCDAPKCHLAFHVTCGLQAGLTLEAKSGGEPSMTRCHRHAVGLTCVNRFSRTGDLYDDDTMGIDTVSADEDFQRNPPMMGYVERHGLDPVKDSKRFPFSPKPAPAIPPPIQQALAALHQEMKHWVELEQLYNQQRLQAAHSESQPLTCDRHPHGHPHDADPSSLHGGSKSTSTVPFAHSRIVITQNSSSLIDLISLFTRPRHPSLHKANATDLGAVGVSSSSVMNMDATTSLRINASASGHSVSRPDELQAHHTSTDLRQHLSLHDHQPRQPHGYEHGPEEQHAAQCPPKVDPIRAQPKAVTSSTFAPTTKPQKTTTKSQSIPPPKVKSRPGPKPKPKPPGKQHVKKQTKGQAKPAGSQPLKKFLTPLKSQSHVELTTGTAHQQSQANLDGQNSRAPAVSHPAPHRDDADLTVNHDGDDNNPQDNHSRFEMIRRKHKLHPEAIVLVPKSMPDDQIPYCFCHQTELETAQSFSIECASCGLWFHNTCIGIVDGMEEDCMQDDWLCKWCLTGTFYGAQHQAMVNHFKHQVQLESQHESSQ